MLQLKIKAGRRHIPIFDLPAAIGREGAYREIGDQIDALIAFMDDLQGDVDLEDGNDDEPDGDAKGDHSWPEWHTLHGHDQRSGRAMGSRLPHLWGQDREDDEDDDPAEDSDSDRCSAGDDTIDSGNLNCSGMVHARADKGIGDDTDDERPWQPSVTPDHRQSSDDE